MILRATFLNSRRASLGTDCPGEGTPQYRMSRPLASFQGRLHLKDNGTRTIKKHRSEHTFCHRWSANFFKPASGSSGVHAQVTLNRFGSLAFCRRTHRASRPVGCAPIWGRTMYPQSYPKGAHATTTVSHIWPADLPHRAQSWLLSMMLNMIRDLAFIFDHYCTASV